MNQKAEYVILFHNFLKMGKSDFMKSGSGQTELAESLLFRKCKLKQMKVLISAMTAKAEVSIMGNK